MHGGAGSNDKVKYLAYTCLAPRSSITISAGAAIIGPSHISWTWVRRCAAPAAPHPPRHDSAPPLLCPRRPTSSAVISHTCGGPSMARRALDTGAPHAALPYIRSPKHDIRKNRQRSSTGVCPSRRHPRAPAEPRQSPPLPGFIWTTRITGRRCAAAAAGPAAQQTARSPTAQPAPRRQPRARAPQAGPPAGC